MVFEILTFGFYLEEKKQLKLLFILMQGHHNEKNETISLSSTQYSAFVLNLFVTLRQSESSVDGKNGGLLS